MTSPAVLKFLAVSAVAAAACSMILPAQAQQVYRIVGPDGKVTFSDKPPPTTSNARVTNSAGGGSGAVSTGSLPFELRQVAQRYPVTLYTGDNCGPCISARALLATRGVPFAEKTVTTFEDSQALQRLSGDTNLPFVTIGGQQLKGFADSEWTQFLNAAGYPTTSILPPSYRQPPATPLVTVSAATAANPNAPTAARPSAAPAPTPVVPPQTNPAGIRF